jgi:hypothetical protein
MVSAASADSVHGDPNPAFGRRGPHVAVGKMFQLREDGFRTLDGFTKLLDLRREGVGVGLRSASRGFPIGHSTTSPVEEFRRHYTVDFRSARRVSGG